MSSIDASEALEIAQQALDDNNPTKAVSTLASAQHVFREEATISNDSYRLYHQLQAIARIKLAHNLENDDDKAWWDVFSLEKESKPSSAEIRQRFKKLATLIHPDKAATVQNLAKEAFVQLQQGMEILLDSIEGPEYSNKRQKIEDFGVGSGEDDEDLSFYEEEFAWWTKWDTISYTNDDNKTGETEKEEDEEKLAAMSTNELGKEIRDRQNAIFAPLPPDTTLQDLKKSLQRARQALNDKLAAEKATTDDNGGGFLPS